MSLKELCLPGQSFDWLNQQISARSWPQAFEQGQSHETRSREGQLNLSLHSARKAKQEPRLAPQCGMAMRQQNSFADGARQRVT